MVSLRYLLSLGGGARLRRKERYLRPVLRRVASAARPAAVEPGRDDAAEPGIALRLRGLFAFATAFSATFEPGRVCRVPAGSRSASKGVFFFMAFPVSDGNSARLRCEEGYRTGSRSPHRVR